MKSVFNRLLVIDLTERDFVYEDIPDELFKKYLGGKGLGAHMLVDRCPNGVDPLSPQNIFIIATGPVTGTNMWGQNRFGVYTKSPATLGYGESYCGGTAAPKIKGCGVDAVLIQGKSDFLVYLVITEEGVTFNDARDIKGAETYKAEQYILKNSSPGASALVIGPAGENMVRFACIKSDRWRSLGRGGMGAVLGSKNLKGISFYGKKKIGPADEEHLKAIIKDIAQKGREAPVTELYQMLGTPMQVAVTNRENCFPTRYWSSGHFKNWKNISADYMQENFDIKPDPCPPCFLSCTKRSTLKLGRHKGLTLEGPEYETIYAIGGLNEIDSLEEVAFLNDLCDRFGLDTMSAGNISAFAVEANKRGRLKFAIDYNQPDRIAELLENISEQKGEGRLLGMGIKKASEELGLEDIAVHVKGLEPAGFEPRVLKGMGLSYATSARGACHLRGTYYKAELSGEVEKSQVRGKAESMIDYEDRAALFDCLVICRFFRDFIFWEDISQIIESTLGVSMDKKQLEGAANRITQMTRAYNNREGLGPDSDTLPIRFLSEKTREGAGISPEELGIMLNEYNTIRKSREIV